MMWGEKERRREEQLILYQCSDHFSTVARDGRLLLQFTAARRYSESMEQLPKVGSRPTAIQSNANSPKLIRGKGEGGIPVIASALVPKEKISTSAQKRWPNLIKIFIRIMRRFSPRVLQQACRERRARSLDRLLLHKALPCLPRTFFLEVPLEFSARQ